MTTRNTNTSMNAASNTQELEETMQVDGRTRGRVCLFPIPKADRVADGPVMRGFLETDAGQIQLAAWKRIGRESGNEYLSLKLGNTKRPDANASPDAAEQWMVGPFYGRLFKQVSGEGEKQKTRYFGFFEKSDKTGVDSASEQGIYSKEWQLQIAAKPATYGEDQPYITGDAFPKETADAERDMPF